MPKIYVVEGGTGEYSDRGSWLTKAFRTEDLAKEYINYLEFKYRAFQQIKCGYRRPDKEQDELEAIMKSVDPKFSEDYTGTYWSYSEVELVD